MRVHNVVGLAGLVEQRSDTRGFVVHARQSGASLAERLTEHLVEVQPGVPARAWCHRLSLRHWQQPERHGRHTGEDGPSHRRKSYIRAYIGRSIGRHRRHALARAPLRYPLRRPWTARCGGLR
jgi:hypothetical protein